jgi:dihydrodipicolinate synthase/N-acetylneuraminate lyase
MEITVEEVDRQIPVLAGIIANSTREAVRRAKAISHLPIHGLQVTPALRAPMFEDAAPASTKICRTVELHRITI